MILDMLMVIKVEGNKTNETFEGNFAEDLIYLTDTERLLFTIVFSFIFIISVIGNLAAIYATVKRNHRFLQKISIVSLAISDLTMAIAYSINNIETFSHPLVNWTLGGFMCKFIPFLQILGITASTSAMVIIALDRYRNVVHALSKRWDPKPKYCILGFFVMWVACIGISYPISELFYLRDILIVFLNPLDYVPMMLCISKDKIKLRNYYIAVATIIFSNQFVIFIWLYYHIAQLVWKHRKPPGTHNKSKCEERSMETSITHIRDSSSNVSKEKRFRTQQQSLHVERKIRTFKIIISLMIVFFVCRIPFWCYNILKLVFDSWNEHHHWVINYIFNALALLNCALNPFLYTFLDATVKVMKAICDNIADFTCKICCCCFTIDEFEDMDKGNPFIVEEQNKSPIQTPNLRPCRVTKFKFKNVVTGQPKHEVYREFNNHT